MKFGTFDSTLLSDLPLWFEMNKKENFINFLFFLLYRYLIASHTTDYQHPMLFLNTLAVIVLVIAKFPHMHKVRIFGINADKWRSHMKRFSVRLAQNASGSSLNLVKRYTFV